VVIVGKRKKGLVFKLTVQCGKKRTTIEVGGKTEGRDRSGRFKERFRQQRKKKEKEKRRKRKGPVLG